MLTSLVPTPPPGPSPAGPPPPAAGWTSLLAGLPPPTTLPPPAVSAGDPDIPLDERLVLAGEWLLPRLLAGESPTAREVVEGVERFRAVYQTANSVGTLLGRGVAGHGFNFYRRGGRVVSCYENARRVVERLGALAPARLEAAARLAGHPTPESLSAAVLALKTF